MANEVALNEPRQSHMLPRNFDEAKRFASIIAESGLFGCKTPEQAFSLLLLADAEGLHPAAAIRDYHIIEGRPSLKADAMLGRYQAAGGKIKWIERTDEKVSAEFTHPSSGTVLIEWDIERASKIKTKGKALTEKDNWRNYKRQMLSARVISEGVRASYPSVIAGVYTPEEVMDFDDEQPATLRSEPAIEATPAPTMSKADARASFSEVQQELRSNKSLKELTEWGASNAERMRLLPPDWCRLIREEYIEMKDGFEHMERAGSEAEAAFNDQLAYHGEIK
jgi:hypothetical protein